MGNLIVARYSAFVKPTPSSVRGMMSKVNRLLLHSTAGVIGSGRHSSGWRTLWSRQSGVPSLRRIREPIRPASLEGIVFERILHRLRLDDDRLGAVLAAENFFPGRQ